MSKISSRVRQELYNAVYKEICDVRVKLRLSVNDDLILAQVTHRIWDNQKRLLGIK